MNKTTKSCELNIVLKNGNRATGLFHTPTGTSSAIRPSDALQERKDQLLLLTDVTFYENNTPRQIPAILMPYDSISYIVLPGGWNARENADASHNAPPTPAPTPSPSSLPFRVPETSPPATPKWMAPKSPVK